MLYIHAQVMFVVGACVRDFQKSFVRRFVHVHIRAWQSSNPDLAHFIWTFHSETAKEPATSPDAGAQPTRLLDLLLQDHSAEKCAEVEVRERATQHNMSIHTTINQRVCLQSHSTTYIHGLIHHAQNTTTQYITPSPPLCFLPPYTHP